MKDNGVWIPAFAGMTRKAEIASRRLAMTDGGRKRNPRQCWNAEETPGVKPGAKYKKKMDRGQERHDGERKAPPGRHLGALEERVDCGGNMW